MKDENPIIIYNVNEKTNIEVKFSDDQLWVSQEQIVSLFQSSKSNISEHINHLIILLKI